MKPKLKKIILVFCVILLLAAFAPFPSYTKREYTGTKEANGKQMEITADLSYWTFSFLFFPTAWKGRMTITTQGNETETWKMMGDMTGTDSTGTFHFPTLSRYDEKSNAVAFLSGSGDEKMDMLILRWVDTKQPVYYLVTAGRSLDQIPERLIELADI